MSSPRNRAEKRAVRKAKAAAPGNVDHNDPDAPAPAPGGLTQDIFDLAALVNTVKATFHVKEETALKTVDLAVSIMLTRQQMNLQFGPPPGAVVRPAEATEPVPSPTPDEEVVNPASPEEE